MYESLSSYKINLFSSNQLNFEVIALDDRKNHVLCIFNLLIILCRNLKPRVYFGLFIHSSTMKFASACFLNKIYLSYSLDLNLT